VGLTVQLDGLAKTYNGNLVLADCSYTFAAGGFYIIMGDNGCGKSTLFRLAALLESPDAGQVRYLNGEDVLPPELGLRRRLTMVFPRVGVFRTTVFENVAYGLKIRGRPKNLIKTEVAESLAQVGLSHKAAQPATTLSSGETMRLALARALVIRPEVLFLDEPTTHIDKANTELIEELILNLRQEQSLTLVMITHDPAQARRLGGHQLLLQNGRLE
jgi:tungstate transport system ATP-binding protein